MTQEQILPLPGRVPPGLAEITGTEKRGVPAKSGCVCQTVEPPQAKSLLTIIE